MYLSGRKILGTLFRTLFPEEYLKDGRFQPACDFFFCHSSQLSFWTFTGNGAAYKTKANYTGMFAVCNTRLSNSNGLVAVKLFRELLPCAFRYE